MNENFIYHKPVLIDEVIQYSAPKAGAIYVDVTFGSGGHTKAILESNPDCKVIAIDWDKNAIKMNGDTIKENFPDKLSLLEGNFSNLKLLLKKIKITKIDGILADFGNFAIPIDASRRVFI